MLHRSLILGLAAAAPLAACATPEPAVVTSEFTRSAPPAWAKAAAPATGAQGVCKVRLGEVRDLRSDTKAMGYIAGRPIHGVDGPAWVGSGLQTLGQDGRIEIVDAAATADVDLEVDILKAYILSLTQVKAATVVVRVRYRQGPGPATEQVYRGAKDSLNFASSEAETRAALNQALARAVDAVHRDVLGFCQAAQPGAVAAPPAK